MCDFKYESNVRYSMTASNRRRSGLTFRQLLVAALMVLSCLASRTGASALCDPDDPNSCGYGAICKPVNAAPSVIVDEEPSKVVYTCHCPPVACFKLMSFDPVCGNDGKTHFNELCRRARECIMQAHIEPVCKGFCSEECKPALQENAASCDVTHINYCNGNGLCKIDRGARNAQPYCKCFNGYTGNRCERRADLSAQSNSLPTSPSEDATINYKLAFLFCAGILGLGLVLQISHCAVSRWRSNGPRNNPVHENEEPKSANAALEVSTSLPSSGSITELGVPQQEHAKQNPAVHANCRETCCPTV